MRIAMIGAPGSGKSHIARKLSKHLAIPHIQSDTIYWQGGDLRKEVADLIEGDDWILEGHISKLADLVFPKADKIIVVEGLHLKSLFRSLKRDWRNFSKAWYNVQNYERLSINRLALVNELLKTRKEDIIFLNNFPDLKESELAAFCKNFKASSMKAQ